MSTQPSFDSLQSSAISPPADPPPQSALRAFLAATSTGEQDERRRYPRVPLTLQGRYMLADGREYACETQDISPIGIAIRGFSAGAIGERIVAYFEGLGRIEGRIVRRAQTWFAVDITATPRKLERLAEKINRLVADEG